MGEVYRARDAKLGRDVAVKVLRQELASDPERLRRFEQEELVRAHYELRALIALDRIEEGRQVIEDILRLPQQLSWPPGRIMKIAALELRAHGHRDLGHEWVSDGRRMVGDPSR